MSLASEVNVNEVVSRTCQKEMNQSNVPADNACQYNKRSLTILLVDHLVCELNSRFDMSTIAAYKGLIIIPSKIISSIDSKIEVN